MPLGPLAWKFRGNNYPGYNVVENIEGIQEYHPFVTNPYITVVEGAVLLDRGLLVQFSEILF